ncbi:MAG: HDOD domain-containing protein [Desulfofustis sp.]|nr:HDOD domain-containing protein [Desulfofustis sp.]
MPSQTALEVVRLCQCDTTSLDDIARVVQADPTLSAEVLKYANSAFLATGVQVASIQRAAVKLGMKTVSHLALCLSLLAANKQGSCRAFDYERFWSVSLARAIAGKSLAAHAKNVDPDELFTCALLSHMGELVLASIFPEEYEVILAEQAPCETRKKMERMRFDIDSAALTAELFLDWGLPATFALAAGFHEELETSELGGSTTKYVAQLLNLACRLAALCSGDRPAAPWFTATEDLANTVTGKDGICPAVFDSVVELWHEWGKTFSIVTTPCPPYAEIKAG